MLGSGPRTVALAIACCVTWLAMTPSARACGGTGPDDPVPRYRDHVELGTAVGIYAATAGIMAIAAPTTAWALDQRDEFPLGPTLGVSVATGLVGFAIASLASIGPTQANECGASELYAERVALLDLVPFALAGAPTLIAWSLSDASIDAEVGAKAARLGLAASASPRGHVVVLARLEL
jgi:hypothetical protein